MCLDTREPVSVGWGVLRVKVALGEFNIMDIFNHENFSIVDSHNYTYYFIIIIIIIIIIIFYTKTQLKCQPVIKPIQSVLR